MSGDSPIGKSLPPGANVSADMTHSLVTEQAAVRPRPLVSRVRFQLLGALLVCLVLPLAVRVWSNPALLHQQNIINSVAGAFVAIVIGYSAWRRIDRYATVEAGAYILWSFIPVFLAVMFAFLMLRLEYNRYVFFTSMALSQAWFLGLHFWIRRSVRMVFGVIEGGKLGKLKNRNRLRFVTLNNPRLDGERLSGVIADLRHDHPSEWETFMADLTLAGVPVYHFKQIEEDFTGQVSIEHLSENSFGSLLPNLNYLKIKQLLDQVLVVLALPVLVPLCGATAIAIALTDGRPVLFRQERMGFRAKPFIAYKFRSMINDPSQIDLENAAMTRDNDPRITRIGKVIRKYRIDELPQVFNIIRGEMSWIGPRPEAMDLSRMYEAELPYYRYRHAVRPGITGWAQVNQGHVTTVQDVHEKLKYDFYYIKNVSFWMDFLIVLKTFRTIFYGFGAR
jgi:lipopolysaccharide/colanic/teichoic acid biosynthesis glycosyltransferase